MWSLIYTQQIFFRLLINEVAAPKDLEVAYLCSLRLNHYTGQYTEFMEINIL